MLTGVSIRASLASLLILLSVAALIGPTPLLATSSAAPPALPGAHEADGPTADDWARLEEVWHAIGDLGPDLWPGWGTTLPPLLLRSKASDYFVGDEPPPAGFDTVEGLTLDGRQVHAKPGHVSSGIGVRMIGDRLGVVLLPIEPMQALLDEVVGPGVIELDDVQYVRWAVHEAFHIYELEATNDDPPRFGFDGDETEAVEALENTDGFGEWLGQEAALLSAALASETDVSLRAAVESFLEARAQRRATTRPALAGFEQAVEWTEGLARYTDVRLLQAAGEPSYEPATAFEALGARYPTPAATWIDATHWLDELSTVPGTIRDQFYESGAAQGYLLDRLMPGWRPRALPGGESLEALLQAGLDAAAAGVPPNLRALRVVELRIGDRPYSAAVADSPDAWGRGLAGVEDLGSLDGLLFEFPRPVDVAFYMKGATTSLDIAFFDASGTCLQVSTMPVCEKEPCPTYRAPEPYRWAFEAPAGSLAHVASGDQIEFLATPAVARATTVGRS